MQSNAFCLCINDLIAFFNGLVEREKKVCFGLLIIIIEQERSNNNTNINSIQSNAIMHFTLLLLVNQKKRVQQFFCELSTCVCFDSVRSHCKVKKRKEFFTWISRIAKKKRIGIIYVSRLRRGCDGVWSGQKQFLYSSLRLFQDGDSFFVFG